MPVSGNDQKRNQPDLQIGFFKNPNDLENSGINPGKHHSC